ncbi:hypothetical protein HK105_208728 [Polyrhizophydium stewartii]|uniref:Expansin-like EG45 domain-containing protein n=1 Tax=Polyrhizophydium stewartii TaxID=2732419 RepID=A0ABR4MWZ6_9FUNG
MFTPTTAVALLAAAAALPAVAAQGAWQTGRCTYHPYEEDMARLGDSYDNGPGWCGFRYTALNVARIVAVHGMDDGQCGQCLEFRNAAGGPSIFVLAVDWKGDPGLDLSRSSFAAAFPGQNPLDPQTCAWRYVPISSCGARICFGVECATPGKRNLLPANLLPPVSKPVLHGLDPNAGTQPQPKPQPVTTTRSAAPTTVIRTIAPVSRTFTSAPASATSATAAPTRSPTPAAPSPSPKAPAPEPSRSVVPAPAPTNDPLVPGAGLVSQAPRAALPGPAAAALAALAGIVGLLAL